MLTIMDVYLFLSHPIYENFVAGNLWGLVFNENSNLEHKLS